MCKKQCCSSFRFRRCSIKENHKTCNIPAVASLETLLEHLPQLSFLFVSFHLNWKKIVKIPMQRKTTHNKNSWQKRYANKFSGWWWKTICASRKFGRKLSFYCSSAFCHVANIFYSVFVLLLIENAQWLKI